MKASLVVNLAADRDVDEIFQTIESSGGRSAAEAFECDLDALYSRLLAFPESGAPRPKLGKSVRIGVIRPYIIIYTYDGVMDIVEVLRILHGKRDIGPKLLRP